MSVGSAIVRTTNSVQRSAERSGKVQPASNARTAAGAESVRRRLSSIFQRPTAGRTLDVEPPDRNGPRPKIQGSNCQSPRAHR